MKIFLATLSLLAAFTINAFAQVGNTGINPNTVSPPIPGAPPAIPNNVPPSPTLDNNGMNTSGGAITNRGVFGGPGFGATSTTRIDQSATNCNNLTGQDLITCRQNFQNSLSR